MTTPQQKAEQLRQAVRAAKLERDTKRIAGMTFDPDISRNPNELYDGEREDLFKAIAKSDKNIAKGNGLSVMLLIGFALFMFAVSGGGDGIEAGSRGTLFENHAGSIVLGAIGVIGWRVCKVPVFAWAEGFALVVFIWELFGGPQMM